MVGALQRAGDNRDSEVLVRLCALPRAARFLGAARAGRAGPEAWSTRRSWNDPERSRAQEQGLHLGRVHRVQDQARPRGRVPDQVSEPSRPGRAAVLVPEVIDGGVADAVNTLHRNLARRARSRMADRDGDRTQAVSLPACGSTRGHVAVPTGTHPQDQQSSSAPELDGVASSPHSGHRSAAGACPV
jgi:hypothetical protein